MTAIPTLTERQRQRVVSALDVATIADVGTSAVSNWRRRHPDFPPIAVGPLGDGYRLGDVVEWLHNHDKTINLASVTLADIEEVFWLTSGKLTDTVGLEVHLEAFLQLLVLSRTPTNTTPNWDTLRTTNPDELKTVLADAIGTTGAEHPRLARAMQPSTALLNTDPPSLADAIQLINSVDPGQDIGHNLSGVIDHVAENLKAKGTFATPESIAELLVRLVGPINGTVYDPAHGAGLTLATAWRHRQNETVEMYGQELTGSSHRLATLHLEIHNANYTLATGDTLLDDHYPQLEADHIVVDPPLGQRIQQASQLQRDPRFSYGQPSGTNADGYWIQHAHAHLTPHGHAAVVATQQFATSVGTSQELRRQLTEHGVIEAVIELPSGVLPTNISPLIVVLKHADTTNPNDILFVDASRLGETEWGGFHRLTPEDIDQLSDLVNLHRDGDVTSQPGFVTTATLDDIENNDWSLLPGRYISYYQPVTTYNDQPIPQYVATLTESYQDTARQLDDANRRLVELLTTLHPADSEPIPTARLGDLLAVPPIRGMRPDPPADHVDAIPYIQTSRVSQSHQTIDSPGEETTKPPKSSDRTTRRGDVLLTTRGLDQGNAGCVIVDFDTAAAFSDSLLAIRANPQHLDPRYLRAFLKSENGRRMLAGASSGSTISNLKPDALADLNIPVPNISEQRAIADATTLLENVWELATGARESIRDLRDAVAEGLLNQVITLAERG